MEEEFQQGRSMIYIKSYHLSKSEVAMIRDYAKFVLGKFLKPATLSKSIVKIHVLHEDDLDNYADIDDLRNFNAWCLYEGVNNDRKTFKVVLNSKHINRKAKKTPTRLKKLLIDLGHELVHVKQYINSEMFDYVSGGVRYKGSYFDNSYHDDLELYYDAPWEVEAYGREWGLHQMYLRKLRDEKKR